MQTKPFTLQSPEDIAKEYGGNKQKIAEAMQMGILDPTAGTMAGMFIDRMRSAQAQEAAPQQTVAQQTFAPPAPPAGLGATPQAAAMPPMGGGAMPQMGGAMPQGMPAPQGEMPMMAEGGMVPPYASGGGLSDLPVPDGMFDEPTNGGFNDGYSGGGLVAFNPGGVVKAKGIASLLTGSNDGEDEDATNADDEAAAELVGDIVASKRKLTPNLDPKYLKGTMYKTPEMLGGFRDDLASNLDRVTEIAPRETKRTTQYDTYLEKMLNPEEQKARLKDSFFAGLGKIGAKMMTTRGNFGEALGAGLQEGLPAMEAGEKELRADERAAMQTMAAEERINNKELETRAGIALDMLKGYNTLAQAFQDQNFKNTLTRLGFDVDIVAANITAGASIQNALTAASASRYGSDKELNARRGAFFTSTLEDITKAAGVDPDFQALFSKSPLKAKQSLFEQARQTTENAYGGGGGGGGADDPFNMRK